MEPMEKPSHLFVKPELDDYLNVSPIKKRLEKNEVVYYVTISGKSNYLGKDLGEITVDFRGTPKNENEIHGTLQKTLNKISGEIVKRQQLNHTTIKAELKSFFSAPASERNREIGRLFLKKIFPNKTKENIHRLLKQIPLSNRYSIEEKLHTLTQGMSQEFQLKIIEELIKLKGSAAETEEICDSLQTLCHLISTRDKTLLIENLINISPGSNRAGELNMVLKNLSSLFGSVSIPNDRLEMIRLLLDLKKPPSELRSTCKWITILLGSIPPDRRTDYLKTIVKENLTRPEITKFFKPLHQSLGARPQILFILATLNRLPEDERLPFFRTLRSCLAKIPEAKAKIELIFSYEKLLEYPEYQNDPVDTFERLSDLIEDYNDEVPAFCSNLKDLIRLDSGRKVSEILDLIESDSHIEDIKIVSEAAKKIVPHSFKKNAFDVNPLLDALLSIFDEENFSGFIEWVTPLTKKLPEDSSESVDKIVLCLEEIYTIFSENQGERVGQSVISRLSRLSNPDDRNPGKKLTNRDFYSILSALSMFSYQTILTLRDTGLKQIKTYNQFKNTCIDTWRKESHEKNSPYNESITPKMMRDISFPLLIEIFECKPEDQESIYRGMLPISRSGNAETQKCAYNLVEGMLDLPVSVREIVGRSLSFQLKGDFNAKQMNELADDAFKIFNKESEKEIESICNCLSTVVRINHTVEERKLLIGYISLLSPEKRIEFEEKHRPRHSDPFKKSYIDSSEKIDFDKVLTELSEKFGGWISGSMTEISDYLFYVKQLPADLRDEILMKLAPIGIKLSDSHSKELLYLFSYLPESVFKLIEIPDREIIESLNEEDVFEVMRSIFSRPEIRNEISRYFRDILASNIEPGEKSRVADFLVLQAETPLFLNFTEEDDVILEAVGASHLSDPKEIEKNFLNPFRMIAWLKTSVPSEPYIDFEPSSHSIKEIGTATWNIETLRNFAAEDRPLTVEDLPLSPEVNEKTLPRLFDEFETRVNRLKEESPDQYRAIIEVIEARSENETTLDAHLANLTDKPYIRSLLTVGKNPGDPVHPNQYKLYTILRMIMDQDPAIPPGGGMLSEREEVLLKISESIQLCPTGQGEGIAGCYEQLPVKYKEVRLKSDTDSPVLRKFVNIYVQDSLSEGFRNETLLTELTKKEKGRAISEPFHQILFLKNRFSRQVGMQHVITYDQNSNVLNRELVNTGVDEPKNVLEKLFANLSPELLVDKFVSGSEEMFKDQNALSEVMAILNKQVGNEIPFSELNKYFTYDPETFEIQKLTKLGAAILLEGLQYITIKK